MMNMPALEEEEEEDMPEPASEEDGMPASMPTNMPELAEAEEEDAATAGMIGSREVGDAGDAGEEEEEPENGTPPESVSGWRHPTAYLHRPPVTSPSSSSSIPSLSAERQRRPGGTSVA